METKRPVTLREVAERFGWTTSKVRREVAAGRLTPAHRLPGLSGALLFDPQDVESYAELVASELEAQLAQVRGDAAEAS